MNSLALYVCQRDGNYLQTDKNYVKIIQYKQNRTPHNKTKNEISNRNDGIWLFFQFSSVDRYTTECYCVFSRDSTAFVCFGIHFYISCICRSFSCGL